MNEKKWLVRVYAWDHPRANDTLAWERVCVDAFAISACSPRKALQIVKDFGYLSDASGEEVEVQKYSRDNLSRNPVDLDELLAKYR